MNKTITLTVPINFDFNSLNLKRDSITEEIIYNTVPIEKILELSGIDPSIEFTKNQASEILSNLYLFHLSQNKQPIQVMEKMISETEIAHEYGEIRIIQSSGLKH